MARIRTIKPMFFRHRALYLLERECGFPVRVTFAGLWTVADRAGRFRWRPEELKLDCLPYDDVDFAAVLEALVGAGFVRKYVVAGKDYGVIPSWAEHQVINKREPESSLPDPALDHEAGENTCATQPDTGVARVEGNGREGNRKGTEVCAEVAVSLSAPVLLSFPTVGPGDAAWRLRQVQVDEWQVSFPNVNVLAECRKAFAWVQAHPGRRKTGRGMPKFLVSWLSRAVDSGRGNHVGHGDMGTRSSALARSTEGFLGGGHAK